MPRVSNLGGSQRSNKRAQNYRRAQQAQIQARLDYALQEGGKRS